MEFIGWKAGGKRVQFTARFLNSRERRSRPAALSSYKLVDQLFAGSKSSKFNTSIYVQALRPGSK